MQHSDLLHATAQVVTAWAANNASTPDELAGAIAGVYRTLERAGSGEAAADARRPVPAVPIRKSVQPDHIVCLEDGRKLKMLKRHLRTAYGMTPEEYRARWDLPPDYPMVAPEYAAQRSDFARKSGLGRTPGRRPRGAA